MRCDARALWLGAALVALAGCGGNYSNEDLLFRAALPDREQLQSRMPGVETSAAGQTQQGLAVGEETTWLTRSQQQAAQLNASLEPILKLLDGVQRLPPSVREEGLRIWGPFDWREQPGFVTRLTMRRESAQRFRWAIEFRRRLGRESDWREFVRGTFDAASLEDIRRGVGSVELPLEGLADSGLELGEGRLLRRFAFDYDTSGDPREVTLHVEGRLGNEAHVTSVQAEDGSGSLTYALVGPFIEGPLGEERLHLVARWVTGRAGRVDLEVLEGDGAGAGATECWSSALAVTYQSANWPGGASRGDAESCIP